MNNIKNILDIQYILFTDLYKCDICFNEECKKIIHSEREKLDYSLKKCLN